MRLNVEALKAIRERSGHSIASLAAEAGLSRPHLSNIESRTRTGSEDAICRLARALKVPVTAIICDPDQALVAEPVGASG
jgi:transcriptional regulator with XRE-family HTH domain